MVDDFALTGSFTRQIEYPIIKAPLQVTESEFKQNAGLAETGGSLEEQRRATVAKVL